MAVAKHGNKAFDKEMVEMTKLLIERNNTNKWLDAEKKILNPYWRYWGNGSKKVLKDLARAMKHAIAEIEYNESGRNDQKHGNITLNKSSSNGHE